MLGSEMASSRRLGSKNSATRAAMIDAAAQVLKEKGFAGLTSRHVAQRAGVKTQLVHYYFRTMDDLTVALARKIGDEAIKGLARIAASDDPLQKMWNVEAHIKESVLAMEFVSMAMHHEAMRDEVVRYGDQARSIQAEAIAQYLDRKGITPPIPPIAIVFLLGAARQLMVRERALGMSLGHREVLAVANHWLRQLMSMQTPRSLPPSVGVRRPGAALRSSGASRLGGVKRPDIKKPRAAKTSAKAFEELEL
jgi:TetR/AcrR family transcriptional regulator